MIGGVGLYRSRMRMSKEPYRSRMFPRKRRGAASVLVDAPQPLLRRRHRGFGPSSSARLSYVPLSGAVGVASFGAWFRSSSRRRFGLHRALQFNVALLFARSAPGCVQLACFAQRRCPTIRWSRRLKQLRFYFAPVLARLNSSVRCCTTTLDIQRGCYASFSSLRSFD